MSSKSKSLFQELVVMGLIFAAVYFGNQRVQSWLGARAIEQTGFEQISFDAAKARAAREQKPMLVDFSAIWCPPCRKLDSKVLADPTVNQRIQEKYVYVRLEYESDDRALFEAYGVTGFPTLLLMNADGKPYQRLGITLDPEKFITQL